jgi:lactoylglutathione lyase
MHEHSWKKLCLFILCFILYLISEFFLLTIKGGILMKLGAFSVSLNVKDISVSKAFYEDLGFQTLGGDITQNWLILKNENTVIGLFQGMFEKNILTFNPGWNQNAENLESFTDIREIQKQLKEKGITMLSEADESTEGPAHFIIEDPDGNQILVDQHR